MTPEQLAVTILSIAVTVQGLVVPFVFWQCFRMMIRLEKLEEKVAQQRKDLDDADAVLEEFLKAAGVPKKE